MFPVIKHRNSFRQSQGETTTKVATGGTSLGHGLCGPWEKSREEVSVMHPGGDGGSVAGGGCRKVLSRLYHFL